MLPAGIEPYYADEEAGIYVIRGDCRDIIPMLGQVDCLVTDPPWITSDSHIEIRGKGVAPVAQLSTSVKYGDIGFFDQEAVQMALRITKGDAFIQCGYKELQAVLEVANPLRGVWVWHKPNGAPTRFYPTPMDASFIVWTGKTSALYSRQVYPSMVFRYPFPQAGCFASERLVDRTGKSLHPAQGPIKLYADLIRHQPPGSIILDPWMGTGTTLSAARELGYPAIGIDINEGFCELAAERLRNTPVLPFPEPVPVPEQKELFEVE